MEIRHLKLIKAIVEEGSITKAIDKLFLTQSALSHQLKEAESQLGTPIFDRINKKLVLTQVGEKVYARAVEITAQLEAMEREIKGMMSGESGEIRISTECYTSYHWLPPVMKQFHQLYPNVDLTVNMDAIYNPLQKLLTGELEVAIVSDRIKDDNIEYLEVFEDEIVAVVSKNHAWHNKKYVVAEDFIDQNLFIYSLPLESVAVCNGLLIPANVTPKKVTVMPLTEATIELVKADIGIKTIARWALKPYLKNTNLRVIKIGTKGLRRKHYIARLKNKTYPVYFEKFIELLTSEMAIL